MRQTSRSLSAAELDDQRVEFLPARTVMSTFWLPANGDANVATTGDIQSGSGGNGGGNGGGQGGGGGGIGGIGGDGGDGGNGIGGNGIGGDGIGGDSVVIAG
ncbi:hypothetical protein SAMN05216215_105058 [Saccharopolyspora shandongensis]|uniref:Uncharacterized protein n=1 Tax=Saccharopolyspora shandongensis TaxID=418495 RepID=A0A1H3QYL9_9PSEU|nr:hypothetical protein [Saccharopolyspora shandongensis]SDZ18456.1 hypothetical protein SAMN05216215_105058 [Saccharopolyspora shandongensis]